jgi:hypothetical protein
MSAPDTSNSKAAPSLLADKSGTAAGEQPDGSRILANLEGRVVPPAQSRKSKASRGVLALVALCVIGVGGVGAWHALRSGTANGSAPAAQASDDPAHASASTVAIANAQDNSDAADHDAGNVAAARMASDATPVPQTATIVADDQTGDSVKSASDAAAPSASNVSGENRLSRALAGGARDASASEAAPHIAAIASASADTNRKHAATKAEAHPDTAKAHRTAVAQAKKPHEAHHAASKDDPDADLLAALVARTKPAGDKAADGKAAEATAADGKAAGRPVKVASAGNATFAQRLKECGARGFFEGQLCRWRVCDGHWGKDPACPAAARASTEH